VYGPTANPAFDSLVATDNQTFKLGDVTIMALHTPGHTMESTTYLLRDESGKDHCIFSGDTLFLGDVGRPDLSQKAADMTQEELAGTLFDSLRNKIMPLSDDVIVYPGHGAGSACGKNMMKETVDTLGNQKKMNYALRANMTKEEFVKEVTDGLAPPPAYFPLNVAMNKGGYESIDTVMSKGNHALSPDEFEAAANETEALILDVRNQQNFVKGFVPRSIFIGLNGGFAPWVGAMIKDVAQPLLLVVEDDKIEEAKEVQENGQAIFDVRKDGEYLSEHIENAQHTSLEFINEHLSAFPKDDHFYVHCAGGYRSVIAASILKSRGYHNLTDVAGGYDAIKNTDIKKTDYVCPTTL